MSRVINGFSIMAEIENGGRAIYFIHASNGDFGLAIEVLDENIIYSIPFVEGFLSGRSADISRGVAGMSASSGLTCARGL